MAWTTRFVCRNTASGVYVAAILRQMTANTTTIPYAGLRSYDCADLEDFSRDYLPGWLGLEPLIVETHQVVGRVRVRRQMLGPHGFLHGGMQVSIADSLAGYGTVVNLPEGTSGFLTAELKTNFLSSLRDGVVRGEATPVQIGRSLQVWDRVLSDESTGRRLSTFRCTQVVLWDRQSAG
jgi:1,4-dihydroxy-2-naphthoyl-CoA hydrolase